MALTFRAPVGELTPTKLKRLPLATILEAHRALLSTAAVSLVKYIEPNLAGFNLPTPTGPRRGRPISQAAHAETAQIYMETMNREKQPGGVTKVIADHFDISEGAAKKRIMAARAAGLLPPRRGNSARVTSEREQR